MKNKGFSIVEILVALSIVILISVVTLPLFASYQKDTKLKNEARLLATNLRLAQQLAVTEQITYNVVFSIGTHSYQIINSKTTATIKTVTLDTEVTIALVNFTAETAQFRATGSIVETGNVVFKNTRDSISTIYIKPSGYVQIVE